MNFSYRNYVKRYKYEPNCWPPDLGLAQLHARCSQPGQINQKGVQCPCCGNWSKKKVKSWWRRDINDDFQESGSAIPGYFQLLKYYSFFVVLAILINSLYPIYTTYYTCLHLDTKGDYCTKVGLLYYLSFDNMIELLEINNDKYGMINVLYILQTIVFYLLLFANFFSIIFITFLNETARCQLQKAKNVESSRCLIFSNIQKNMVQNLQTVLNKQCNEKINVIKVIQLYQIKKYYQYCFKRNRVYYNLLSLQVIGQNPVKYTQRNELLQILQMNTMFQKQKINKFCGKVAVIVDNVQSRANIHKIYKIGSFRKWWFGFLALLKEWKIYNFDQAEIKISTRQLKLGTDIIWQNMGEQLGVRMATKIKSFVVAVLFLIICYNALQYPMYLLLKTNAKQVTSQIVQLTTFQMILPTIISIALVIINIFFRIYMGKLSEQRNPQDHLEISRFLLITCLTFHACFYIMIPTIFYMFGPLDQTVQLYVVASQAKTYIVIQVIILLIDLPYRIWASRKIVSLSDQRVAFKNNQKMLHKIVEYRDYPLEIRLQALFRIWSLVLFYSFVVSYMLFYIIVAFAIIYWVEKRNLYKHYVIKKKISIKLQSSMLIYNVNFFCIYLCFIYCYTLYSTGKHFQKVKIIIAIIVTCIGLIVNILYWAIMKKGDVKSDKSVQKNNGNLGQEASLLKKQNIVLKAEEFSNKYRSFIESIRNDGLDGEIQQYIKKWRQSTTQKKGDRKNSISSIIELQSFKKLKNDQPFEESDYSHQDQSII